MSPPNLLYRELFPNLRSSTPDVNPDTSSPLFPTLRTYLKSPSREIQQVRRDQGAFLTQVELEKDETVQEYALRGITEVERQSKPLEDRINATKLFARLQPNTRLGFHSEIQDCRRNLDERAGAYRRSSDEAAKVREQRNADLFAQERLQKLTLTASGSTAPRQAQQGARPNRANASASNLPMSRDHHTNTLLIPIVQREAESRTQLSCSYAQITTATEGPRNEERPPSYTTMPSTSERGHELGLSAASPQDLSPTRIQLPHEVQDSLITQPTRSAEPSSGYIRPLPNPPAVPSTGTPVLQGVDALAVTPGQNITHRKTMSQSPFFQALSYKNHPTGWWQSANAEPFIIQQATQPTYSNHVGADTVPSQSTDRGSSADHGNEFRRTNDDGIAHSFSQIATVSDGRAFHPNPGARSVKASDGHDLSSTTTSSHVSQRHASAPSASQPEPDYQGNTPNSSVTPVVGPRKRSASQALKPSSTQSYTGSRDRRVHDEAAGQSPGDLKSGQISQSFNWWLEPSSSFNSPTVPLKQPPVGGIIPTLQVDQRKPSNSSATPIASPRQQSQPSSTQSYTGSRDRRVHDEAAGQSPGDLKSGQISQSPTVPLKQPPVGGIIPTRQVDQRKPSNSSATPIASPRQQSQPSSTQSYTGSRYRRVHDEALGQSPRNLESGQISQDPTVPLKQPPVGGIKPTLQVDQRKPSNSSATPIASPRQRSASQAPEPSSTQSYTGSRYRRVHDEALGQSPRNLESGQISQDPTIPPRHPPLGSLAPTLRTDNEPETTRPTMRVKLPIAGSEHAALPPTRGAPDADISNPAPQNERPSRSPHTVPAELRIVHRALDLTPVDYCPELLNRDALQRR
ncbi:hypothetical protein D9615_008787 [Tricholomella constricta]|uniref:Uncharacterized protein n=1 Tax=Tricholomella constricta TaxID=117010 RepID=A0A8H5H7V4_9AGAR|nr:hypothetical protein D9615_008787 [Tricholomella constricta]